MARVSVQSTVLSATSMTQGKEYAAYYLGEEKTVIKGQDRNLHLFRAHEDEDKVAGDFKIWGTMILDDRLSTVPKGQLTFVTYEGKRGKSHIFSVEYDDEDSITI